MDYSVKIDFFYDVAIITICDTITKFDPAGIVTQHSVYRTNQNYSQFKKLSKLIVLRENVIS